LKRNCRIIKPEAGFLDFLDGFIALALDVDLLFAGGDF